MRLARRLTFSLFAQRESKQRESAPGIRPITSLRYVPGTFAPSAFQGRAAKGHPWPIAALAASLPLNPFHTDSAHPPDGTASPCKQVAFDLWFWWFGWRLFPYQEAERRCRVEGHLAWMPNEERWAMDGPSRRPSERCRSEGSRAQRDPDAGVCFFCLLCFAQAKKSEAPGGAQQKRPVSLDNQPGKMQIKHQRITNPLKPHP